ncbi:MAG: hypothetical protein J7J86_03690 [Bacteroidales bacterium]|nr:hypothetical protein [Bacteroidales bacterium]
MIFFSNSCKDTQNKVVPYVYVNFYIEPNSLQYENINTIGNSIYVTGGNKGIIIYRKSTDEFMAFDRTCTYDPDEPESIIEIMEQGTPIGIDSLCGSKFLLLDGMPFEGPATIPLLQYRTNFDGIRLHVYN